MDIYRNRILKNPCEAKNWWLIEVTGTQQIPIQLCQNLSDIKIDPFHQNKYIQILKTVGG
jgi:hypothetical protein